MSFHQLLSKEIKRKRVRSIEAAAEDIRHQRSLG
jgi:hypothetical protein